MVKKDDGVEIKHVENLAFAERMLNDFKKSKDTLDMTGCDLNDDEIFNVVLVASQHKPIQNLKLAKNKLTNEGLLKLLPYIDSSTSLNLSYNQLTEDILEEFINFKSVMPSLRIVTLTHNKIIHERKAKAKVEELKKMGVITAI